MTVISEIAAERRRQVEQECWTAEHDDTHRGGELADAAACYALARAARGPGRGAMFWPWDYSWYKPRDDRQNMIRAAALLVAEIERLDRAAGDAT